MQIEMVAAVFAEFSHNLIGHECLIQALVLVGENGDVVACIPVPVMFRIYEAGQASFNDFVGESASHGSFAVVRNDECFKPIERRQVIIKRLGIVVKPTNEMRACKHAVLP
jgi:hypothetical protein